MASLLSNGPRPEVSPRKSPTLSKRNFPARSTQTGVKIVKLNVRSIFPVAEGASALFLALTWTGELGTKGPPYVCVSHIGFASKA